MFLELARHHSHIESVGEIQSWPSANTVNNSSRFRSSLQHLVSFTNLKGVSLKSANGNFSDLGEAFKLMANQQTVERLQLNFGAGLGNFGDPVRIADLKRLGRLKSLNLSNFIDSRSKDFINMLCEHLPALESCAIDGKRLTQTRILELVKCAPNLKVWKFLFPFKFSPAFYGQLRNCRRNGAHGFEVSEDNRLILEFDRNDVQKCLAKLGRKRYKPELVLLKAI